MWQHPFPAKVLLLGEYAVLRGGIALAVPFSKFTGQWQLNASGNRLDAKFVNYLQSINEALRSPLDLEKLKNLEEMGWRFVSDIPQGKGLGSSAALTASLYRSLAVAGEIADAHADLALIESFFHGKSSGLDALVSYLGVPICYHAFGGVQVVRPKLFEQIYLLDSEIDRSTGPLVQWFRQQLSRSTFSQRLEKLKALNELCAAQMMAGDSYLATIKEISELQFDSLRHLIPAVMHRIWSATLRHSELAMKLCGAGGGGFFIVVTGSGLDVATIPELNVYPMFALNDFTAGEYESGRNVK